MQVFDAVVEAEFLGVRNLYALIVHALGRAHFREPQDGRADDPRGVVRARLVYFFLILLIVCLLELQRGGAYTAGCTGSHLVLYLSLSFLLVRS